jgi:hypothetical protein
MMYLIYVAVCPGIHGAEGLRSRNGRWIGVAAPEPQPGLAECAMHGQEYAANSRLVHDGQYVKVLLCCAD